MKLTNGGWLFSAGKRRGQVHARMGRIAMGLIVMALAGLAVLAQGISTTTVQGTVYLANGLAGTGTVSLSWPAFTTAAGQEVAAGQMTVTIAPDGFLSVNLTPNQGATPAGLYYTAVYHMSDGTTSTQYWVVPATAQASLGQVQAELMPAAQAVQTVDKAYVDQSISEATTGLLTGSGGTLSGPLYLSGDPAQPLEAADKHYVDSEVSQALPVSGGTVTGATTFDGPVTFASTVTGILPAGVSGDGANGIVVIGNASAASLEPKVSPYLDIRRYGAVIDGATPIDAALSAAYAAANAKGAATGATILLPCVNGNGSGCYLANGSILNTTAAGNITLLLQGELTLGSTFVPPDDVEVKCAGGTGSIQFQNGSPSCAIMAPQVSGTLGTAITSTNTPVSFTPAFTSGSIANFYGDSTYGSAITIAGITTCTITSITRTAAASNNVVATLSSSCRIPAGTTVTVTGVSDSTFNTTPMVTFADYPAQQLTWTQTGQSPSTSSGGTVTGFNEDSFETVRILSVSGSTVTAVFTHTHSASDQWGMVGVALPYNTYSNHAFDGVGIWNNIGAGLWAEHNAFVNLNHVGIGETANITSIPLELDSSWWVNLKQVSLLPTLSHFCSSNCGQQGYPYGLRCTDEGSYRNPSGDYACEFTEISDNSVIGAGIKVDTNDLTGFKLAAPIVSHTVFEQPINGAITVDPRTTNVFFSPLTFHYASLQDSFMGYPMSWVNFTDRGQPSGEVNIDSVGTVLTDTVAGKYFTGRILINGTNGTPTLATGRGTPVGTINSGSMMETELDGIGASMGPSLIPYATQSVTTDPASWTCAGTGCTITTGVMAPDGTATAGTLTTGAGGTSYIGVGGVGQSTAPGDWVIFGAWVRDTNLPGAVDLNLYSYGATDTFVGAQGTVCGLSCADSSGFQPGINGMWWHPVVAAAQFATGTASAHALSFRLIGPPTSGEGISFWQPFLLYIPASAGVTADEVERWRQQLMHGYVPSGLTSVTLAADLNLPASFGSVQIGRNTIIPQGSTLPYAGFKTYSGSGNPTDPCSATANYGAIETNSSLNSFQCSNANGTWIWNPLGGMSGPTSSTAGDLPSFGDTTGKMLADSGLNWNGSTNTLAFPGAVNITAGGTNQNITLNPSGAGKVEGPNFYFTADNGTLSGYDSEYVSMYSGDLYLSGGIGWGHPSPSGHELVRVIGTLSLQLNGGNCSGVCTLDFSRGNLWEVTLTGNVTSVSFANLSAPGTYHIIWLQGATPYTVTGFPASWHGITAPSATANTYARQTCDFDGENGYCGPVTQGAD